MENLDKVIELINKLSSEQLFFCIAISSIALTAYALKKLSKK